MHRLIACPSPRGTNRAGLFIKIDDGRMAMDAMPVDHPSMDAETRIDDAIDVLRIFANKMSPEDWLEFCRQLRDGGGEIDGKDDNLLEREMRPMDDPLNPRSPAMDRRLAHDARAAKSFQEHYPDASRLAPPSAGYGIGSDFGQSPRTSKSFETMFPDAARVGVR